MFAQAPCKCWALYMFNSKAPFQPVGIEDSKKSMIIINTAISRYNYFESHK